MNVSVFGLGYVGSVTAASLAAQGHNVVGVDVNADKVEAINHGQSPVVEPGLGRLIRNAVRSGNLSATQHVVAAVEHADVSLICVGTPSNANGSLNSAYLERVSVQIGGALAGVKTYKVVALRSTVLPGTFDTRVIPVLTRESGKRVGADFGAAVNPEFLREGSAVQDFVNPPLTLIGEVDERSGDTVAALYHSVPGPVFRTNLDAACMVKYASNAFHALKVTFANEIGRLCKELGIDSTDVMEIFCQDTRLNISPRYLQPGFAFGGSCLPKDLRTLLHLARHSDVDLPVLEAVLPSNARQIQIAIDAVMRTGKKRVAIVGLSFKPQTDDLRESPMVHLTETLLGRGFEMRIYDRQINLSRLVGSNRAYIEQAIPHLSALMCDSLQEALEEAEVVVASHGVTDDLADLMRADQTLIDLVRMSTDRQLEIAASREGIC